MVGLLVVVDSGGRRTEPLPPPTEGVAMVGGVVAVLTTAAAPRGSDAPMPLLLAVPFLLLGFRSTITSGLPGTRDIVPCIVCACVRTLTARRAKRKNEDPPPGALHFLQ